MEVFRAPCWASLIKAWGGNRGIGVLFGNHEGIRDLLSSMVYHSYPHLRRWDCGTVAAPSRWATVIKTRPLSRESIIVARSATLHGYTIWLFRARACPHACASEIVTCTCSSLQPPCRM
jgi:hypothetical protein